MEAHLISSAYLSGDYLLDFPSSKLIIYELITLHIKLELQPPLVHTRISYRYLIFAVQCSGIKVDTHFFQPEQNYLVLTLDIIPTLVICTPLWNPIARDATLAHNVPPAML